MNELNVITAFLLLYISLNNLLDFFMQWHYCRKAQFDCEFCKYWSCPVHRCRREREKRQPKEEYRCQICSKVGDCPAANTGVLYPCQHYSNKEFRNGKHS